jgi:hypothetical protein
LLSYCFVVYYFYFWQFLGFELKALLLLGRHSYHLSQAPISLSFCYFFQVGSPFCPGLASGHDLPVYATCVTAISGVRYHVQLVFSKGVLTNFLLHWH